MSLARQNRLLAATDPAAEMARAWTRLDQHEANIEAVITDWREGWARDAQFIPAWNDMTVAEAVAFIRGGEADR
jgi:hypothetical protein